MAAETSFITEKFDDEIIGQPYRCGVCFADLSTTLMDWSTEFYLTEIPAIIAKWLDIGMLG